MISQSSIDGHDDKAFEAAMKAFQIGPPGVLRAVQQCDSYPGEEPGDPDAYAPLKTSVHDERVALAEAINAYQEAQAQERKGRIMRVTVLRDAGRPDTVRSTSLLDLLPRIDAVTPEGVSTSSFIRDADIVILMPYNTGLQEQVGHVLKDRGLAGYDIEVKEVVLP